MTNFPTYIKSGNSFIKINSENFYIEVFKSDTRQGINLISLDGTNIEGTPITGLEFHDVYNEVMDVLKVFAWAKVGLATF